MNHIVYDNETNLIYFTHCKARHVFPMLYVLWLLVFFVFPAKIGFIKMCN